MTYATVAEAEVRISELEKEVKTAERDLMTHKKGYKDLSTFLETKGLDPKSNLDEQWEGTVGKAKSEVESQKSQYDKLAKQLEKIQKDNEQLTREREESEIRNGLSSHVKDIIGNEEMIDNMILRGRAKRVNGKIVYSDGDDEKPIEKFFEEFKKKNPDRVRVQQNNGGQSSASQGQNEPPATTMTKSKFSQLSNVAKQEFLAKNGEVVSG